MRATRLLHKLLNESLPQMHRKRLQSLVDAVSAIVGGSSASITDIGRALTGQSRAKHRIKRVDRLIGNRHLNQERESIYGWLCQRLLTGIERPIILVDWSCLNADQSVQLLRAGVAIGGRSLTLYEEVHPLSKLTNRRVHNRFLKRLHRLVPTSCCPVVIGDSGFRGPFYQQVERLGWHWIGRIRGRDMVDLLSLQTGWVGAKTLYRRARKVAKDLGSIHWTRSRRYLARAVLCKRTLKGRQSITHDGLVRRTHTSLKASKRQREPWLLVVSNSLHELPANTLVKMYATRMQIELGFRDTKSHSYGLFIRQWANIQVQRLANLLLLAAIATFMLWLIGTQGRANGADRQWQVNTNTKPVFSWLFLAMMLVQHDAIHLKIKDIDNARATILDYYQTSYSC